MHPACADGKLINYTLYPQTKLAFDYRIGFSLFRRILQLFCNFLTRRAQCFAAFVRLEVVSGNFQDKIEFSFHDMSKLLGAW